MVAKSHLSPKEGATVTPDWLLTFLSRQEERDTKREHLANERESLREERHGTSMRVLCETLDGRMRVSARDEQIVNSEDTTTGPETQNTGRSNVQIVNSRDTPTVQDDRHSRDATHAKARPPEQMSAEITLRDLSAWRSAWEDFAEIEQISRFPERQQRAMLRINLTVEMRAVLQIAIGIDSDEDISVATILDQFQEYVHAKRNVTLDRVALEERKQEECEAFDQFYISLREIANNADLCKICIDDRLTTRIMSGIRDPETRCKLLAYTPRPPC